MTATVLIRKQRISVTTEDASLGHRLRQKLNGELQEKLLAALERTFAEKNQTGDSLHIQKIQVDLGALTLAEFEQRYIPKIEEKLLEALQELFDNKQSTHGSTSGTAIGTDHTKRADQGYQLLSPHQQTLAALFFYLEHGMLPWWFRHDDKLSPTDLIHNTLDIQPEKAVMKLLMMRERTEQAKVPLLLNRLFQYLSTRQSEKLIHLALDQVHESSLTNSVMLLLHNQNEILKQLFFEGFHKTLLECLMTADQSSTENFIYSFLKKGRPISLDQRSPSTRPTQHRHLSLLIQEALDDVVKRGRSAEKDSDVSGQKKTANAKSPTYPEETLLSEGLFLNNAGIILLHPFLPTLFNRTGLLEGNQQFLSNDAQRRAAIMLHYLASGGTEYHEWNLSFNKVLVGLPLREVFPPGIILSLDEKQHCDDLLEAAVQHWKALKGASVAAVRQTFLIRNGKLAWKDKALTLYVERTTTDVLLERLPWGFSTVKLPWLTNIIYTTW